MNNSFIHTPAGRGPHHLMIGTVSVSRLLGGQDTNGQLAMVELTGLPGSGPGPHLDPWRESFYVLHGELTFRFEEHGTVKTQVARAGDAVSIPCGVGHAFSVTSPEAARYLMLGAPAGIEAFFADAGDPLERAELPSSPTGYDRDKLRSVFAKYNIPPYTFPAAQPATQP